SLDHGVDGRRGNRRRAQRVRLEPLVRRGYVLERNHRVTSSPHSCRKCPPFSITSGSRQLRIQLCTSRITDNPSTGSVAPMAMKLSPRHAVCRKSLAFLEIAAPGSSKRSGTIGGKRRTPAL